MLLSPTNGDSRPVWQDASMGGMTAGLNSHLTPVPRLFGTQARAELVFSKQVLNTNSPEVSRDLEIFRRERRIAKLGMTVGLLLEMSMKSRPHQVRHRAPKELFD